jgi:outer membrane protein
MLPISAKRKSRLAALLLAILLVFATAVPDQAQDVGSAQNAVSSSADEQSLMAPVDPDAVHNINKTLGMDKLRLDSALKPDSFNTIRLEATYDESITLAEALQYAVENNLAIKISRGSLDYQRFLLYGQVANALPNLTVAYNLTHTNITNERIQSLARVFLTKVTYPVFQGGSVLYSILGQYYREKGWVEAYKASISDALLDLYQKYNNLLLARVLLQIRGKAVELSQEQVRVNQVKEREGTNARVTTLQSIAQLASDRQALLQQEVAVRQAALALNFSMNYPMGVNLVPVEETITEESLFQNNSSIDTLVRVALKRRPELREYELFKVAAARNIQVAAAPLYPQVALFQQFSYTNTTFTGAGLTSASGSGSTAGAGVFGGLFETYQQGLGLVYTLTNMGVTNIANIAGANALKRQAGVQANQELQTVLQQVRSDYLSWRAAREQIDNAAHGVTASAEELRLAMLRLDQGVGTYVDVIQAQNDYINALTTQAQAIVGSNLAQAQLLHDTGIISTDTLLHGFKGDVN